MGVPQSLGLGLAPPKLWLASRLEVSRSEDVADMALGWLVDVN